MMMNSRSMVTYTAFCAIAASAFASADLSAQATWTATPATEIKLPIPDVRSSVGYAHDAAVLSDGRVAVAVRLSDGRNVAPASTALRFFDASGKPLQVGGPTGMALLPMMFVQHVRALPNDMIEVFGDRSRVVINGKGERVDGQSAQLVSQKANAGSKTQFTPSIEFPLSNGSAVGYYGNYEGAKQKQWPLAYKYVITSAAGETKLTELPAMPFKGLGANWNGGEGYHAFLPPAFASRPMVTVSNDMIFIGNSGKPEIQVFSYAGKAMPTIRLDRKAAPVTAGDVAGYRARELASYAQRRDPRDPRTNRDIALYKAYLDSVPPSKTMPYFGNMLASASGELWVSEFTPDADAPTKWTVLSPSGAAIARVTLPGNFTPSNITADRVVGITRNGATDQRVIVLKITR